MAAKVPASIRSKNPGAMWPGPISRKWGETKSEALADGTGQGNKIAYFPTFVQGICAQIDLWRGPRYRNKTFAAAIAVWSGGNHVESYIAFVLARVPGMKRDQIINDAFLNSPMGIGFLKAQAWHEAGRRYPAPDADWIEAQKRVFGGTITKPKASAAKKAAGAVVVGAGPATAAATQGGLSPLVALAIGIAIAVAIFVVWKVIQSKTADKVVEVVPPSPRPMEDNGHSSGIPAGV